VSAVRSATDAHYAQRRFSLGDIRDVIRMAQELIRDSKAYHESIEWDGELVPGRDICDMLDKADTDLLAFERGRT
jgi:hypothetical protein